MANNREPTDFEPFRDGAAFAALVAALESAVNCLPVCDTAAKMRGLVWRLKDEAARGARVDQTIDRVATLARAAVAGEPWMRVDRASVLLKSSVRGCSERSRIMPRSL